MQRFVVQLFTLTLLLTSISCGQQAEQSTEDAEQPLSSAASENGSFAFQWEALAEQIVRQTKLQQGEKVLLVGNPGEFDALFPILRQKITAAGGEDLGAISVSSMQPADWSTNYTQGAEGKNQRQLEEYFRQVDIGIMLPGAMPADLAYRSIQNILDGGTRRTIHFHWAGAYGMDMTEIEPDNRVHQTYQNALLNTNYERLATVQRLLEHEMRQKTVTVTTPAGTHISFEVGDRPVTRQDGDASAQRAFKAKNLIDREIELPAGAVRVAPIEAYVDGVIHFPDSEWGGTRVTGLTMTFSKGKLTNWTASSGQAAVEKELQTGGEAARSFREFALGLNPLLAIPAEHPWIPYYGYGAGVVRLSLGDNTELGGKVTGGYVRWNFFTDATVRVGDDIWVKDGKLVVQ